MQGCFVYDNWVLIQEGLHAWGVFGYRILVWPVAKVHCLANFSLCAFAYLFTIAVILNLFFHVLN